MDIVNSQNYSDPSKPNYRPSWWADMVASWDDAAAWSGNLRNKTFKNKYLKTIPGEFEDDRKARIDNDSPEPYFKDAVKDHASIFSQFELDEDAPASLIDSVENVDGQGTSIYQWAIQPMRAFFRDGGAVLGADISREIVRGERIPRLIWVPMRDVFWVEYRNFNGVETWARVSIRRSFTRQRDRGQLEQANRYFVYELDDSQSCFMTEWEDNMEGIPQQIAEPIPLIMANGEPMKRLPFTDNLSVLTHFNTTTDNQINSLFDDILSLNIEHFNARSELNAIKTKVAIPTLDIFVPVPEDAPSSIYSGSGKARIWSSESRIQITQLEPSGLQELRQGVYDLEAKLEKRNNRLFYTKGNRSATEADIENQKAKVGYPSIKQTIESAFQDAFQVWELYAESSPNEDVGGIRINDSVLETAADPEDIKHYLPLTQTVPTVDGVDMGAIIIEALKRQGIITAEDIDQARMMNIESPEIEPLANIPEDEVIQ